MRRQEAERLERVKRMPPLAACYNLMDFETVARQVMKKTGWAYYSSGADDEIVSLDLSITTPCSQIRSDCLDSLFIDNA